MDDPGHPPSPRGLKASAHKFIFPLTQYNLVQQMLSDRSKKTNHNPRRNTNENILSLE